MTTWQSSSSSADALCLESSTCRSVIDAIYELGYFFNSDVDLRSPLILRGNVFVVIFVRWSAPFVLAGVVPPAELITMGLVKFLIAEVLKLIVLGSPP